MQILFPTSLLLLGIVILISDEPLRKGGVYIDFTQVKWIAGPFLLVYGGYLFYRVRTTLSKSERCYYKCPQCGFVKELDIKPNPICEKCNSKVEKLEGFFERHPK